MSCLFTADAHWGHSNILRYCNRPFSSIEEHDEILIQNWNKTVASCDTVYFLGDFCMPKGRGAGNGVRQQQVSSTENLRRRLNGTICFIEGNHDWPASTIKHLFSWYASVEMVRVGDQEIWLSHYAHRIWPKSHFGSLHAYGHSHNTLPDDPCARSMDVGIDAVAARLSGFPSGRTPDLGTTKKEDYRPLSFDEMKAFMATKTWKPIDHHGE